MKKCLCSTFVVIVILALMSTEAHALDFEKEIARREIVTVSLINSLDKDKKSLNKEENRKGEFKIQLISKKH